MGGLLLCAQSDLAWNGGGTAGHIAKNGSDASSPLSKKEAARSCEPLKC